MTETTNERQITIKPHARAFAVWYVAIFLFAAGPLQNQESVLSPWQGILIAALIALGVIVKARTSRLVITPETILRTGGLFNRTRIEWPLSDLARVTVMRGLIHKLLNVGVLQLEDRDASKLIRFWGVESPLEVKAAIENMAPGRLEGPTS